jgi:hypothetical protein
VTLIGEVPVRRARAVPPPVPLVAGAEAGAGAEVEEEGARRRAPEVPLVRQREAVQVVRAVLSRAAVAPNLCPRPS